MTTNSIVLKLALSALMTLYYAGAMAQKDAQVRPGLWEFTTQSNMQGAMAEKMKEIEAKIATMPENVQQQMREMMAKQMNKSRRKLDCITPAQASKGIADVMSEKMKKSQNSDCKQELIWIGGGKGTFTIACNDGMKGNGKIAVKSKKEVTTSMVMKGPDGIMMQMNGHLRWKSDQCGDVKSSVGK